MNLLPVCGTDGVTYDNICLLRCERLKNPSLEVRQQGACDDPKRTVIAIVALQAYTSTALRPCVCARNFRPVCGSDGKTYSNECRLNCEKYKVKNELTVASKGPCSGDDLLAPTCICTLDYKPVCGNDGTTYPNRCSMMCTRSSNPTIDFAYDGQCSDEVKVVSIPLCTCTDDLNEVCGSDGTTYANDCLLNCATANDNTLSIAHAGKCESVKVVDNLPIPPPCTCARDMKPVCGSDGNTYNNDCLLNCATANDNTLSIAHAGKCESVKVVDNLPIPPPCTCARDMKPVCGSDGNTYNNDCLLNCATANDNTLSIAHAGKCESVKVVDNLPIPPPCTCARDMKPVCGSDGNTYNNDCLLNCATANDNTLSIAHAGKCETVKVVDNLPIPPPCTCARDFKPVCGSDGTTYTNDCLLNCATANDNTLSISHAGKCETVKVVDNLPIPPPCTCVTDVKPVCGSDGKTYTNDCLLNCATANDNTLSISHAGKCGEVNVVGNTANAPSGCTCTREMEPVCGSDGVMYNNICLLKCAGQSVAEFGKC
ncbi:Brasiliensin [Operophtera brumata]|uniref:Brasiliensin n=1 Tax=Operophtera brumata TaxID=104452 RepID=A0A0L7KLP1_OPEBR|nr:Brasiliensin [Operophtera brumata]